MGNPCVDAVDAYCKKHPDGFPEFVADNGLSEKPVIALLAGSRKQEIKDNLPMMLEAAAPFTKDYQLVLAGAPGMDPAYYAGYINPNVPVKIIFGQTYRLLQHAQAALVTSGTATLETGSFPCSSSGVLLYSGRDVYRFSSPAYSKSEIYFVG